MAELSFVTLLAYDYRYAPAAIASYYSIADEIILGLDKDRLTWAGQPFQIDMPWLNAQLQQIDPEHKIRIIEEDFHSAGTALQNDTRERNILSQNCAGRWIVQIDADEILLNPKTFRKWLEESHEDRDVQAQWLSVFKIIEDSYLVIDGPAEYASVATTRRNSYVACRQVAARPLAGPAKLLHFSWGRSADEVRQKLANWGHGADINAESYLNDVWSKVTLENYFQFRNFHPLYGPRWSRLRRLRTGDLPKLQSQFAETGALEWPDVDWEIRKNQMLIDRPLPEAEIEAVTRLGITAQRVLEIGCSSGRTGQELKQRLKAGFYVGIEPNRQAAELARSKLDAVYQAELLHSAPESLGLAPGSFDLLVALDVLDQLTDPQAALIQWARAISPDGMVLVSFSNLQHIHYLCELVDGRWATGPGDIGDPARRHLFTRRRMEEMLHAAGFGEFHVEHDLFPKPDLAAITDEENKMGVGRLSLSKLNRNDVMNLLSRRIIMIARRARN